ncbi:MAG TPA: hypothetical protein VGO00_07410 [Kofleriaceae bacterium]|jgi:hypothetical protein|nr:hypothetical protein [Kofleriaceae bacterium]
MNTQLFPAQADNRDVPPTIAIRLDHPRVELGAVHRIADILSRPCFACLERIGIRRRERIRRLAPASPERIARYATHRGNDAVVFDGGGSALAASAELELGRGAARTFIAIPLRAEALPDILRATIDLAMAVHATSGFVATEPDHATARGVAVGLDCPRGSERRRRERRARRRKAELLGSKLATIEWGTFLGPGHLVQVKLARLQALGVFERIVDLGPELAFLQLTSDPTDDLGDDFEVLLARAREVMAPMLVDISDVD